MSITKSLFVLSGLSLIAMGCANKSMAELDRIHFKYDDSSLSADAIKTLKDHAVVMKKHKNGELLIEGHTDERGTNEYNIALGEHRAKAARDYLVGKGIAASRLITKSWGEEKPLQDGQNEKAYAKNRRDEFVAMIGEEEAAPGKQKN